ncbi:MAG: ribosome small subunit-dependent GTPase A [Treponema sp.]|nr:ribosome small subunit-dependent GTPase A [Treponema sp.]
MKGTVLGGTNNTFSVECEDNVTRLCAIKGKQLKSDTRYYNPLAPGDIVKVEPDEIDEEKGLVTELLPRKNAFLRWNVKGRTPQVLASNLDYLLLVTTPDEPPFRPRFIDRELAQAECQNLVPVIVCNKYDLPAASDIDFQNRLTDWENLGYTVLRISAKTGEGLSDLASLIKDKTCALVGQSGIGKSSLVNVLDNSCVLKTGSLSQKYGRGQHTTTKGTLLRLHLTESLVGGLKNAVTSIIDTPGIRRFVLNDISGDDLAMYFREFKPLIGKCSFGMSCKHQTEPGCKILEAVHAGVISEERYESWLRIREEIISGNWKD